METPNERFIQDLISKKEVISIILKEIKADANFMDNNDLLIQEFSFFAKDYGNRRIDVLLTSDESQEKF